MEVLMFGGDMTWDVIWVLSGVYMYHMIFLCMGQKSCTQASTIGAVLDSDQTAGNVEVSFFLSTDKA